MPYNSEKINLLPGGWYCVLNDGTVHTEEEIAWLDIPNKRDIKLVGLKRMNKYFELENKQPYFAPGETHMKELTLVETQLVTKSTLVGWFIGYYDGAEKVYWRVDAETGKNWYERVSIGQQQQSS